MVIFTLSGANTGIIIPDDATLTVSSTKTLSLEGDSVVLGNETHTSGTIKYAGGVDQAIDTDVTYNDLTISGTPASLGAALDVNGDFALSGTLLNTAGKNINIGGNWNNTGTYTKGTETVTMDGSDTQTIGGSSTFNNLTIANTHASNYVDASDSTLVVSNILNITDGEFKSASDYKDVTIGAAGTLVLSGDITVSGNWSNSGAFTPGENKVTLDGTDQTLSGVTSFYDLTKNVNSADTLTFTSGSTNKTTITNTLNLTGESGEQLLSLRSSSDDAQWEIDPQGTRTIEYLDVQNSNNVGTTNINAVGQNCTDSGNNTKWSFTQLTSGTYYVDAAAEDDSKAGTAAAPWKTFHYAIDRINNAAPGTSALPYILIMAAGTYNITDNGEADTAITLSQSYVTIIGESGSKPTISGLSSEDWEYGIKVTGSHVTLKNLNITGFTITNGTGIEIVSGPEANSTNNTIENCRVYGNYDGISISNSDAFTVRDSEIDNNEVDGISISQCTNQNLNGTITRNTIHDNYEVGNSDGIIVQNCNPEISRNKIYDNRFNISLQASDDPEETTSPTIKNNLIYQVTSGEVKYGILMGGAGTVSPKIYHNTIDGGSEDGINISGTGNAPHIKYNIITGFGDYGVYNHNQNGSPVINYNDAWNNSGRTYFGCVDPAPENNISEDPKYASYSLQSDSPCINKIPSAEDPVTLDYPGFTRPRPGKATKDMGAYEYIADVTNNYTLPGGTGVATDYRIFTVPLNLGTGADMLTAMENVLGTYDPVHWRGFLYSGTSYREFNSDEFADATIKPGMGFWIITTYTNQIPFNGGPAPDGVDYVMTLDPGWHLIGLPWTDTQISLGNMTVTDGVNSYSITGQPDNARLTQELVWDYTGSYVQKTGLLSVNTGYFFKVEAASSIRLTIPHDNIRGQDAPVDVPPNQTNTNEDDEAPPPPPGSEPIPDIKANGEDGPVTVSAGDPVSVSVNLDPGAWNGRNADWWVGRPHPV